MEMDDDNEPNNILALKAERALEYSGIVAGPINPITGNPRWVRQFLTRDQRRKQIEEWAEDRPPERRAQYIKEQTEIDDEIRKDPIVLKSGRISAAAEKRAQKIVENRFTNKATKLIEDINKILENDKGWSLDYYLENDWPVSFFDLSLAVTYIDHVLNDLTPEELKFVEDIAKALTRLARRAEGWSVRLMPSKRQRPTIALVKEEPQA
jgi:hypothetical protein